MMPKSSEIEGLTKDERAFLEAVRDDKDVFGLLRNTGMGVGWAIERGFVTKHPAWFEFYITDAGRAALSARPRP